MRVTTFCDSWLPLRAPPSALPPRAFHGLQRSRELLRCRPPPGSVVPSILVGTPQHHTVRVVTRCLELEPPIVTQDVAKGSRRTHVILRPKEKVDGFLRVERTRFCLGGLRASPSLREYRRSCRSA